MSEHHPKPEFRGPVYHLFPLGALGAAHTVDEGPPAYREPATLRSLIDWIPHIRSLGADAVLLGPIFHSESHGYDTIDLYTVDPRLGSNEDLAAMSAAFHDAGISVLVDAVFNHVGRQFFAFRDVLAQREHSPYCHWFSGLRFDRSGPAGDGVDYDTWDGHGALVKLDTTQPDVVRYIMGATTRWIEEFGVDGLRLDAADVISPNLWPQLRQHVDERYRRTLPFGNGRFWLNGEMVHGDYGGICGRDRLDGTTNYEAYKGLYSSHNDRNYFEIAHSLQRQFGPGGIYRGLDLLNFVDNHDVSRIASMLDDPRHLYPAHVLLFTMPGTPAVYYGSETGIAGEKGGDDDWNLRPPRTPAELHDGPHPDLCAAIARLAVLRREVPDLAGEDYEQLTVSSTLLAFRRGRTVVAVNAADTPSAVEVPPGDYRDALNGDEVFGGGDTIAVPPLWGRVLVPR